MWVLGEAGTVSRNPGFPGGEGGSGRWAEPTKESHLLGKGRWDRTGGWITAVTTHPPMSPLHRSTGGTVLSLPLCPDREAVAHRGDRACPQAHRE